jgi:hypothetical protein
VTSELDLLRAIGARCEVRARELDQWRDRRDRLALKLIDRGFTWRQVAEAAGFGNSYIAELKKRRNGNWKRDAA